MVVCNDELETLLQSEKQRRGIRPLSGVHQAIAGDVHALLAGKSHSELCEMEKHVQNKLVNGESVDAEYWESLLKRIAVTKAKAVLNDIHKEMLERNGSYSNVHQEDFIGALSTAPVPEKASVVTDEEKQMQFQLSLEEEARRIEERAKRLESMTKKTLSEEEMLKQERDRPMEEDEEVFKDEVTITGIEYPWIDKYRPRKPRYFNRVQAGYEWNKYNQTHYDHDNPPPKAVQGYQFNIFYPDLIDKASSPRYFVSPDPKNPDLSIIRFEAGPPYETVAFRIVNKEWEYSHRKGYKCSFERGILHLWFYFKKYRYRR